MRSAALGSYWLARLAAAQVLELLEVARRELQGDDAAAIRSLCASIPIALPDIAAAQTIGGSYADAEMARLLAEEWSTGESRAVERLELAFTAAAFADRPPLSAAPGALDPSMTLLIGPAEVD